MTPAPTLILYPVFAMFFLVGIVVLRMGSMRFAAVRSGEVKLEFYRAFPEGGEPEPLRVVHLTSNNVIVRLRLYFGSVLVLVVMWSSLLVRVLRASANGS